MRVAVTGGTGFLGRYLVAELLAEQHQLRCWRRPTSNMQGLPQNGSIQWIEGRLGDQESCQRLVESCDAVIHAALWRPGDSFRGGEGDIVPFVETNVIGTLQLIEAARAANVERFVFISSCAVHERIMEDRRLDETHPLWPTSHYGAHKAAIEKFVHSYGLGEDYPICALRPCGIYGVAHPPEDSKWFSLVRAIKQNETVQSQGGGKEVHASDVARAAHLLLRADVIAGQSYNCCDRYVSEFEVATIAKRICGSTSEIQGQRTRPRHRIVTEKLDLLGMKYGAERLEQTIGELVKLVK